MSRLELQLLGPPQIERDGVPVEVRRRKAVALLAYLAVTARPHTRDALATLFWPEQDQSKARASLRRTLATLRRELGGECLEASREMVRLSPEADAQLDVASFQEYLAACQDHDHSPEEVCPSCLPLLAEAATLYRDDFLAGFTLRDSPGFDEWQFFQTQGLRDDMASALERLARAHGQRRELETAIDYARRWLALDSLHEPAHRLLMDLYAQAGQRAAALRQYDECTRILEEELGLPPSEETRILQQEILTRAAGVETPAARPSPAAHNLPAQTTPFIGRLGHVDAVREQLARPEVRLLTLTGAGGTGKTRLSLQVAAGLLDNGQSAFADGIFFVALAPVRDPALVAPTIAQVLGVREIADWPLLRTLQRYLSDKRVLLVVDNFEHLMEAGSVLADLLAAAPGLKALVTSRASLHIYGEQEYPVPPMDTSDPRALPPLEQLARVEAVQLFAQRGASVKAGFALTQENAPAVAQICARLDGLPLAIELAAARVRALPPRELLSRLDSCLGFLTGGPRNLPDRQQTLRATIDWSYDLLEDGEKALFRRLAVFAGGCTLDAAEVVGNPSGSLDALRELEGLVDKNLLRQSEVNGEARFAMLETIREYALERLVESGEAEALHELHADYYLSLAEELESEQDGAQPALWLGRLDAEGDNLRVALAWSLENATDVALRLAGALGRYWTLRGKHTEGREWMTRALAQSEKLGPDLDFYRAKALYEAGELVWCQGDFATAELLAEESANLWRSVGNKRGQARALCNLGSAAYTQGDPTRAGTLLEESVALHRQIDDRPGLAKALFWHGHLAYVQRDYKTATARAKESIRLAEEIGALIWQAAPTSTLGRIALDQGDYAAAQSFYERSLMLYQAAEDNVGIAIVLEALGNLAYAQGRYAQARQFLENVLAMYRESDSQRNTVWIVCCLGYISLYRGQLRQARRLFAQGLDLARQFEHTWTTGKCLAGLAELARRQGDSEQAARLLGTADSLLEADHRRPPVVLPDELARADFERSAAATRNQLGEAAFAAAWAQGKAADPQATVVELLAELGHQQGAASP